VPTLSTAVARHPFESLVERMTALGGFAAPADQLIVKRVRA